MGRSSYLLSHRKTKQTNSLRLIPCDFSEGVAGAYSGEDPRKQSGGSAGESKPALTTKARAEANPLGSKLGLSTGPSPLTAAPIMMAAVPRGGSPSRGRGQGRGRGRGRGRGLRVAVPGRGGRPLHSPLMQVRDGDRVAQKRNVFIHDASENWL